MNGLEGQLATWTQSGTHSCGAEVFYNSSDYAPKVLSLNSFRKPLKILCIDEATANVDQDTDRQIQLTLRSAFRKSTVITIAHRIQIIMDSDRVLVMQEGEMIEFDSPENLLNNPQSHFSRLHSSCLCPTEKLEPPPSTTLFNPPRLLIVPSKLTLDRALQISLSRNSPNGSRFSRIVPLNKNGSCGMQ
ncbi:hypothetical protein HUJ04_009211 [Dendroctonus ponderosae]|nr:hypothetical protein HUJ04_009211 [Dendroctonus ponderosae]